MTDDYLTVTATEIAEAVVVLTSVGEIDRDSVQLIGEAAEDAFLRGRTRLVLDLAETTFCDSAGLAMFLQLDQKAAVRGGSLHMASVRPEVLSVLRISNLDQLFHLHPTLDVAVKAAVPTGEGTPHP